MPRLKAGMSQDDSPPVADDVTGTVQMDEHGKFLAVKFTLPEGMTYEDEVTVTLTRADALAALVVLRNHSDDMQDVLARCVLDALRGDEDAQHILPMLVESENHAGRASRALARSAMPQTVENVEREQEWKRRRNDLS